MNRCLKGTNVTENVLEEKDDSKAIQVKTIQNLCLANFERDNICKKLFGLYLYQLVIFLKEDFIGWYNG